MPGVANYTGGSRHHLAAARLHPERATQRRYFAEHRYGPELGRLDADRRKERMQFDLAWVRPAMGVEEAGRGTAVAGASKRPAAAPVNEEEQATLTRAAQPPAKKARTSTILQALDDDPVVLFDQHRRRLLAEDDWAGLDISVDRSPLRRAPDRVDVDEKAGVAEPARTSHTMADETLLGERQSYDERVHVARAASSPSSARLTLRDHDLVGEIDGTGGFDDDYDGGSLSLDVYGAGKENPIQAPVSSVAGDQIEHGARSGPPSTADVGDDRNLERLAFPPPASVAGTTHPTLADNPRSIFSAAVRPGARPSTAAGSSPAPSSAAARARSPASTPMSRSFASASTSSARRSTGRLNESITSRILDGKEPLRTSLATLVLDFPTNRRGVAQPRPTAPSTPAAEDHDALLLAPSDESPDDVPPLPNPFKYLAAALKLQDLVGSSSSDG